MSEDELQEEVAQQVEDADDAPSDDVTEAVESTGQPEAPEESFGTDSDVDASAAGDLGDAEAPPAALDVSALPEIEANYADENLNELIRRALAPITDETPCGDDEDSASSAVSQIATTLAAVHEALRVGFGEAVRDDNMQGFDIASIGREAADLIEQVIECLEEKCKSSILASYLPQLMLIEYGVPGFSAGLDIFRELLERYDGHLYPRDPEKLKSYIRRGVYVGNDDKVTDNFRLFVFQPITEGKRLPYALLRNSRIRGSNTDVEGKYANDAAGSKVSFYVTLINDLNQVVETARAANSTLGGLLEDPVYEIVSYSFIDSIERMANIVTSLATDNCAGYPPVEVEEVATEPGAVAGAGPAAMTGEIVNRDQAIDLLGRIADFFHRTERHSPVSYRIKETIRWCKMDLPELLQELLSDDQGPLDELGKRVGFRNMDESEDSGYDG